MKMVGCGRIGSILLVMVLTLMAFPLFAENGRDFSGVFSATDVVGGAEEVAVSLSLVIYNFSGQDVTNATVRIERLPPEEPLYEFPSHVDIIYRDYITVTEPVFVIPRSVYEQWVQGVIPLVTIGHLDEAGNSRSAVVDLLPMNMDEEVRS